jgi:deoxyribodipyrimidine photo-lyase
VINEAPTAPNRDYVLYWMIAARRARYNFALERATELALEHKVGVVVLEALRLDYEWASERLHAFILQGMRDNAAALSAAPVAYYPYVERRAGAGSGLLTALARRACVVVTDDFPCSFLPRVIERAAKVVDVRLEAVDGNGIYPMRATERIFTTAASFRRHLQKEIAPHLGQMPMQNPARRSKLARATLPRSVARRWKRGIPDDSELGSLDIDHEVRPTAAKGGSRAAAHTLSSFIRKRLELYVDERNQPSVDAQSNLSPYLHFGHISTHEIFIRVMRHDEWSPERLASKANGSRAGWWGASGAVEAFLDQLVTWRELGFNRCAHDKAYASYSSLPEWAERTLSQHAADPRVHTYGLAELEAAKTHDPLWNAAQRQLVREGTIHNYLRMLWGKKILEWTRSPQTALAVMIELNNKYALDGRDPNSYSGIFWVLGRYDRAWGPERPIFGKVRYMSSDNTARKIRVKSYLERFTA